VVHDAVDGGGGRERAAEDLVPLAEDQVARDHERATLVSLGEEREEHLGLGGVLLHVAEIVEDEHLELVELAQRAGQREIALGREQLLDQAIGGREVDGVPGLDQAMAERAHRMRLARPGQAEGEQVGAAVEEGCGGELGELVLELRREPRAVEARLGLAGRELRGVAQARHAPCTTVLGLELEQVGERGQRRGLAGRDEARLGLGADRRKMEAGAQVADAPRDSPRVRGAHRPSLDDSKPS
jgi:hypothetical protein